MSFWSLPAGIGIEGVSFFPTAVTVITRPALPRHASRYSLSHKGEEVTSEISN